MSASKGSAAGVEQEDLQAVEKLRGGAAEHGLDIRGAKIRRSSSRFCLGVEHGDYNGTELFGVGTNRFIWLAYQPNGTQRVRLFSQNFAGDGRVEFTLGEAPTKTPAIQQSWARFPFGVDAILKRDGFRLSKGMDGVVYGNIPGGGMSRSASLTVNLITALLDANGVEVKDPLKIVDMAQAVENVYIGSPCGQLDQIMILFAKDGMGTHYNPKDRTIQYVPAGAGAENMRIVVLDTGTDRPGLEKSTYKVRRAECEEFAGMIGKVEKDVRCLADVKDRGMLERIMGKFGGSQPHLCRRLDYIFHAQQRFYEMMEAWHKGDMTTVGRVFREDGIGLRDLYQISGPELETMCDIARAIPGVLGERMLGGGDKGAAGALCRSEAVAPLKQAVETAYPRSRPDFAKKYAVHVCKMVQGITVFEGLVS